MAFALGVLRWPPGSFWAATPREVAAAVRGVLGRSLAHVDPPARGDVAAMRAAFPDEEIS